MRRLPGPRDPTLKISALLASLLLHAALMVGATRISWRFTTSDEQIAFAISFRTRSAPASDDPEGLDPRSPVMPPEPESAPAPHDAPIVPLPLAPPPPQPMPFVPLAIEPKPGEQGPIETPPLVTKDEPHEAPAAATPPESNEPPTPELPPTGPTAASDTLHAHSDVPSPAPSLDDELRDGAPIAGAAPKSDDGATTSEASTAAAATPAGATPPHQLPPPRPGEVASDTDIVSEAATDFAKAPVYPLRAIDLKLEGIVTLLADVTADGEVSSCEIETSSGHALLDEAARKALRKWRFKPRRTNGVARPFKARVPFDFHLLPRQ